MTRYQAPKGTQDWTPDKQPYYRWIDATVREVAARYGFLPIDPPMFEHTEVFARGVGTGTDIVEKEMYSFETQGGEPLTLRPEFTAGIVRAYVENGLHNQPPPVKLYAIGPLFRYERPGMGRYRQHTQISLEVIGESDPAVDLEIMSLASDIFETLGVGKLRFEINSIGCPACRPPYIRDTLVPWLEARREHLGETDQMRLAKNPLRVLDTKDPKVRALMEAEQVPLLADSLCQECRTHFDTLRSYMDMLGRRYTVNPLLVRGFDYYTKTVFEVQSEALDTANNALCGGGRYDGLVELLGGAATPGMGMGLGFERAALVLEELDIAPPPLRTTQVYAVWFDEATKRAAIQTLDTLRQAAIPAEMAYAQGKRSFKSQMRAADKSPARFTLIFGENELAQGEVMVKEMATGNQTSVRLDNLVLWLQGHLG
ncbi:MAG: histidine--tRNA ligase [Ardenticatenales bacterium]|nr:histidine--tRNA ligase [Ardenticatenales bacterium]